MAINIQHSWTCKLLLVGADSYIWMEGFLAGRTNVELRIARGWYKEQTKRLEGEGQGEHIGQSIDQT